MLCCLYYVARRYVNNVLNLAYNNNNNNFKFKGKKVDVINKKKKKKRTRENRLIIDRCNRLYSITGYKQLTVNIKISVTDIFIFNFYI